ncbi:MAG: tRNA uridine-5-carboxymethylaminomethyl(34) synthesis GTPase MnmE [Rickettsiales bacterium]|nr:tRNA uridine-5-carboxymethylaminomethyl(34) synthesis GTPase MnmE [Rickettsiales bacterium]
MPTIFAPITQGSRGGISVIRISGSQTRQCLQKLGFKGEMHHQKISLQKIRDPKTHEIIDEALVAFFASPKSFTGEDVAEISIHGSPFILKKIFEILAQEKNVRFAQSGEFSKRAFLNGKLDLVQAEAIPDLIAAETAAQHKQALQQLSGKLGEIYEDWRFRLIEISAMLEAAIDFPDEDLPKNIVDKVEEDVKKLATEINSHLDDKKIGQKIKNGLSLAIIGAPNVGKSSLINFLAQSEVAIVSEIAGTTRDVIETHLSIAGVAVKICDTAGIHETENKIEQEGIRRALKKAADADLKIFLVDATKPILREDLLDENTLIVVNKIDLVNCAARPRHEDGVTMWKEGATISKDGETTSKDEATMSKDGATTLCVLSPRLHDGIWSEPLQISLTNKINTSELLKKLEEKILEIIPNQNLPLITEERYRVALENAVTNLENFSLQKNIELSAEDLRIAAREIGKITGKVDIENILDVIFSRFCIGK